MVSRISVAVALCAALVGGVVLYGYSQSPASAVYAAKKDGKPGGRGGTHGFGPASLSAKSTADLTGWAKDRLTLEKQRRAHTLVIHSANPGSAGGGSVRGASVRTPDGPVAGTTAGFVRAASAGGGVSQARAVRGVAAPDAVAPAGGNAVKSASLAGSPPRAKESLALPAAGIPVGGSSSALVLYDTTGPYGQLGELYAMAAANLAGHFGSVTAKPVSAYTSGMTEQYTATYYIGSTYYGGTVPDAVPAALYQDVLTTSHPVTWIGDNIWNLANAAGVTKFQQTYGWDPTNSYFASNGSVGSITQVTYKGRQLTRKIPAGQDGGVLHPAILTGPGYPQVTALAQALDSSTGTTFPWALRSGNLTYVGEIPFAYVSENDRVVAFEDLLFDGLAPATPQRHRAFVRLEDISPKSSPSDLRACADYLFSQHITYGINVIPEYTDPNGYYNNGTPETVTLAQAPDVVSALRYMLAHGAVLMNHGLTHQYRNVNNPYTGVTGDDFEFFLSHIDASNNVVLDGPPPEDSALWAQTRVTSALALFQAAGLPRPTLWTTPHYAASAADYGVIGQNYGARLERSLYYAGTLSGGTVDATRYIGEFFPYAVKDVYGTTVLPENLGNYEPLPYNNHPARLPADLIASAQANLAVRDGVASFFYHPYYGTTALQQIVSGIQGLGYTFVGPTDLAQ
ncbi:DUF2334 domain-containing protein [Streptomyces gamaensis]|uniref:DUF2334 domain-containing protein n=1 Tax=Streptomyces gamaensis TaxID=1763542 RepID=A0ABW0Z6X7_9ACTN